MHCAFFHFVSAPPLKPQYASYFKKSKRINKSQMYENFEVDKSIYFNVKPSQRHAYRLSYIKEDWTAASEWHLQLMPIHTDLGR